MIKRQNIIWTGQTKFDILSALKDGDSLVLTYLAKVNLRLTGTPG